MKTIYFLAVICLLSSCKTYVYRPTTVKATNFKNKNDCEFSVNGFMLGELHAAYAVTNHVAVSGTLGFGGNRTDTVRQKDSAGNIARTTIHKYRGKDQEFAVGYFTEAGDGNSFEVFAGVGYYKRNFKTLSTDHKNSANNFSVSEIDNRYSRIFIQPAYGRNGKYLDYNFANRFTLIQYAATGTRNLISETVFTVRYGYKNIKIMNQIGVTIYDPTSHYGYFPLNIGFGLYLMFNQSMEML